MSKTHARPHTPWNPKLSNKLNIQRVREHPRHAIKRRLRLSVSRHEIEQMDTVIL